ncbi:hypothetical protein EGI22_08160 [Lacihabitans sp. LS3-19]|uniref:hypothetical protein n=1 Tax=Lacihabitans sp. LS3-19 TaxID=2487335 RepID=UPI0020CFA948|nr:hypothetical protein [Lacihabitans sp. LS3-19]MCP9767883.1 hypothetical protein [Lacihabitans sp. LS3-19]
MRILGVLLFLVLLSKFTLAQTVASGSVGVNLTLPEIALLDIEPNNSAVSLALKAPNEAGSFVKTASNTNAKWLNYTSAVRQGQFRNVTVQIEYGSVPPGTKISLSANSPSGGGGTLGTSNGTIALSYTPQKIINLIGGAYTGNGANSGHALSYTLEVTQVADLDFNSSGTLGLIYTLIDN